MKSNVSFAVLTALAVLGAIPASLNGAEEDGVALAIIYDTSGSMRENVRDNDGHLAPKYVIANRALIAIAKQLQTFATNSTSGAPRKLETAVFVFANNGAREVIKFGPFDAVAMTDWARNFSTPGGNTPLGNALNTAGRAVLSSPLSRKHVLIITDGINTAGPPPQNVLPKLKDEAAQKGTSLSVHFVAFDVDAKIFDPVKKQGATVVGAANEQQLDAQLKFIMQKRILLEDEEAPAKK